MRVGRLSPSPTSPNEGGYVPISPLSELRSRSALAQYQQSPTAHRLLRSNSVLPAASRRTSRRLDSCSTFAENILTGVRLRPPLAHERKDKDAAVCVLINPPNKVILTDAARQASLSFGCNHAFDSSDPSSDIFSTQEDVYTAMGTQIVESATNGYNCCLCAYGQTGTGKTHTIHGDWQSKEGRGLLPRIAEGILDQLQQYKGEGAEVRLHVSYIEIYNNKLFDLLATAQKGDEKKGQGAMSRQRSPSPAPGVRKGEKRLDIHTHPTIGVYVDNLTEHPVETLKDVGRLALLGEKQRHTATTSLNVRSSRSHTIFYMKLEVQNMEGVNRSRMSTVQVVDLAGRENEQTSECKGERFKELTFINRSLFQLANVVQALSNGDDHVPFRNSKLTMLLSESIQRNSRTHLLATLTPSSSFYEENLLTCRFLESCGRITTQPVVNRWNYQDLQVQLQKEIDSLRQELNSDSISDPGDGRGERDGEPNQVLLRSRQLLLEHIRDGITSMPSEKAWRDKLNQVRQAKKVAEMQAACQNVGHVLNKASQRFVHLVSEHDDILSCLGRAEEQLEAMEIQAGKRPRRGRSASRERGREPASPASPTLRRDAAPTSAAPEVHSGRSVPEPWDLKTPRDYLTPRDVLPPVKDEGMPWRPTPRGLDAVPTRHPTVTFAVSLPPIVILE